LIILSFQLLLISVENEESLAKLKSHSSQKNRKFNKLLPIITYEAGHGNKYLLICMNEFCD